MNKNNLKHKACIFFFHFIMRKTTKLILNISFSWYKIMDKIPFKINDTFSLLITSFD